MFCFRSKSTIYRETAALRWRLVKLKARTLNENKISHYFFDFIENELCPSFIYLRFTTNPFAPTAQIAFLPFACTAL